MVDDSPDAWAEIVRRIGFTALRMAKKSGRCAVPGCRKKPGKGDGVCHAHWLRHVAPYGPSLLPSMVIPKARWTPRMVTMGRYSEAVLRALTGWPIRVDFVREDALSSAAMYRQMRGSRRGQILLNLATGDAWSDWCVARRPPKAVRRGIPWRHWGGRTDRRAQAVLGSLHDILVHEASHTRSLAHGEDFLDAAATNGARLAQICLENPFPALAFAEEVVAGYGDRVFMRNLARMQAAAMAIARKATKAQAAAGGRAR